MLLILGLSVLGFAVIGAGFIARRRLARAPIPTGPPGAIEDDHLAPFVRPYLAPLAVSLALTLFSTGAGLLGPWSLKFLLDQVVGGDPLPPALSFMARFEPREQAALAALAGVGLVLVKMLFDYLVAYLVGAVEQRVAADLRTAVFHRLHELSLPFHDHNRTGDLVARLTEDVSRVRDAMVAWFDQVVPEVLTLVGILTIALLIDPLLTAAALVVVPLLLYYALAKRPVIRAAERAARARQGQVATLATESLRNVRLIQAFARQDEETDRFRREVHHSADAAITSLDVSARYTPMASVVLALGTALVSWIGVVRVLDGRLSVGTLVVFLAYLSGVYSPIRSLSRLVSTFAKGAASRERLVELFQEADRTRDHDGAVAAGPDPARLVLRQVSFGYDPGALVLDQLDLTVEAGETVCIVGASGAGKSTLLALLLRLYEPTGGTIELAGIDLRRLTLASLRQRIALVPQEPWIMDGSIEDNIRFGLPSATRAELRYACRRALVDEFAFRQPQGYDTPVGEGGALLSGGQLRRIALARALVRDASILLLDEPTTGLDATSSEEVQAALRSMNDDRTVIIVSHDLSLAASADRIVVLEGGSVAEAGDHDTLLARGGRYRALWTAHEHAARHRSAGRHDTVRHDRRKGVTDERVLLPQAPRARFQQR